ncbi:hypothetical protein ACN47E_001620 [Coniothyrium glycines]
MAAPSSKTLQSMSGKWQLNKSYYNIFRASLPPQSTEIFNTSFFGALLDIRFFYFSKATLVGLGGLSRARAR